jgi:hypothetical protein
MNASMHGPGSPGQAPAPARWTTESGSSAQPGLSQASQRPRACTRAARACGFWTTRSTQRRQRLRTRRMTVIPRERKHVRAVLERVVCRDRSRAAARYLHCRLARDVRCRRHRDGPCRRCWSTRQAPAVRRVSSLKSVPIIEEIVIMFPFAENVAMWRSRDGIERLPLG